MAGISAEDLIASWSRVPPQEKCQYRDCPKRRVSHSYKFCSEHIDRDPLFKQLRKYERKHGRDFVVRDGKTTVVNQNGSPYERPRQTEYHRTQCPNCGGFRFHQDDDCRILDSTWKAGILLTFGLALVLFIPYYVLLKVMGADKIGGCPYLYVCELCGNRWEQKPGEVVHATVNPHLISLGEQRLQQEAKEREKLAQGWYIHHQKDNN